VDQAAHHAELRRLGELLRRVREDAGLVQADVARDLGVPQSFVSKYESGERRLDLIELKEVAGALSVPLVELVSAFVADSNR